MIIKKQESKPIKTLDELIDEIKGKNIIVEDVEKTKELLKRISRGLFPYSNLERTCFS
jgi:abortive infection bacteriophage resistance protein